MDTVTASAVTGWCAQAWANGWTRSASQPGPELSPGVNVWATKPAGMAGCACRSPSTSHSSPSPMRRNRRAGGSISSGGRGPVAYRGSCGAPSGHVRSRTAPSDEVPSGEALRRCHQQTAPPVSSPATSSPARICRSRAASWGNMLVSTSPDINAHRDFRRPPGRGLYRARSPPYWLASSPWVTALASCARDEAQC